MKKPSQHPTAEIPRRQAKVEMMVGIDLGDVWSHCCPLNQNGEVVDRGRFRTTRRRSRSGSQMFLQRGLRWKPEHSIWISEQLQELGHEVIVANVRELLLNSPI